MQLLVELFFKYVTSFRLDLDPDPVTTLLVGMTIYISIKNQLPGMFKLFIRLKNT
jgi:hypothetical protein